MIPFPIVGARIHPPLLRADTLSRERLNGWLDRAASGRLALIVAEAGFGKTTLLADWARQSRRLTAWYRLEPDDRDWLTFTRHLAASGRELDPGFAPETHSLLAQLGPGGPRPAEILASLVREYAEFGAAHPEGLTLIFDDYHSVDGSDEVVPTVKALLDRTGPGFSLVIASRSTPRLPLSRLRTRGAVSRLGGEALCFDAAETDRLFREAYHQPIERDVIDELVERTEGWPALLSLVHANLEEQPERGARSLVAHLVSGRGGLYDYLAEVVLEGLSSDLHAFLVRVSVLASVDTFTAGLVDDRPEGELAASIEDAEQLGLLARPASGSAHRFHPLVRNFLLARLREEEGSDAIRAMHGRIAWRLAASDWLSAAWHYREAGDPEAAANTVDAALGQIFALGQFEKARSLLDGSAGSTERPGALLLRSRLELARGNYVKASQLASEAVTKAEGGPLAGMSLINLASVVGIGGFKESAVTAARLALEADLSPAQRNLAEATIAVWDAEHEGDLDRIADAFRLLAARQDREGHQRYAGVTRVNLAGVLLWLGEPEEAVKVAARAELDLGGPMSGSAEYVSAVAARSTGLAQLGRLHDAEAAMAMVSTSESRLCRDEAAMEMTKILADFGDLGSAETAFGRVAPGMGVPSFDGLWMLIGGQLALRQGRVAAAESMAAQLEEDPCSDIAGVLRGQILRTRARLLAGAPDVGAHVGEVRRIATTQHSRLGGRIADVLRELIGGDQVHTSIASLLPQETYVLSMLGEELAANLHRLSSDATRAVSVEAHARPARWVSALRLSMEQGGPAAAAAAELLAEIGTSDDAAYLRLAARGKRSLRPAALRITRRLAPKVLVADLGVVDVTVGGHVLPRGIRRKVLALLCFVSSRPAMAVTRDEAVEAIWPGLGPETAVNSLHQTIYFLRRVFETDYREGLSAGYVDFEGEVLRLNPELVDATSRLCWRLVADWKAGRATAIDELLAHYTNTYALDFTYEEWAAGYRDNLHAAVLDAMDREIGAALNRGDFDRAIQMAQQILRVDPTADAIELLLLRAYKRSKRHAAAAEQYAHYAAVLREELGAEPPPFSDI